MEAALTTVRTRTVRRGWHSTVRSRKWAMYGTVPCTVYRRAITPNNTRTVHIAINVLSNEDGIKHGNDNRAVQYPERGAQAALSPQDLKFLSFVGHS